MDASNFQPDDISIVTAFFDIGRGEWASQRALPAYVHRTTDTYFERFGYMASLDNEMVVYTSPDLVPRVLEMRRGKEDRTSVISVPIKDMFTEKREAIRRVQEDPAYKSKINPKVAPGPEYWSPDYVLVTNLKAVFTANAIAGNLVHAPQVAWMDFGYCRDTAHLGGSRKWQYCFAPGKMHMFGWGEYPKDTLSIADVIYNNIVFICGAALVAERHLWAPFAQLTVQAVEELMQRGLVDDDQTMFLLASLYNPELSVIHQLPMGEWQPVLRLFNKNAVSV